MHIELASKPIVAKRGLPQGNSVAPGGTVGILAPWQPQGVHSWLFMDDRSMVGDEQGNVGPAVRIYRRI